MPRRLERGAADVSGEAPPPRAEAATIKFIHFRLDSCNENLPEKCIHRNYASRPGGMPRRVFCCAHASRGRARRILVRQQRERRLEPCRFRRAKAEIRPAGRAGRAIGQRSCWKIWWGARAEPSGRRANAWRKAGITAAIRMCMARRAPARRDEPVVFDLPPLATAADSVAAAASIVAAVAGGELAPSEGADLAR